MSGTAYHTRAAGASQPPSYIPPNLGCRKDEAVEDWTARLGAYFDERTREAFEAEVRKHAGPGGPKFALPGGPGDIRRGGPSLTKFIRGVVDDNWTDATAERALYDQQPELQRKALSYATPSAGGYLVPQEQGGLIELVRAMSVAERAGATVMTDLAGAPYVIPRQTAAGTAEWLSEGGTITASTQTLGQVSMAPKIVGALSTLSRLLIATADPNAEEFVRNDLAESVSLAIDLGALDGTGADSQPLGLARTAGVSTQAVSATITYDELIGFPAALRVTDTLGRPGAREGWVMAPESWNAILALKDTVTEYTSTDTSEFMVNDRQLVRVGIGDGQPDRLLGYPVYTSSQLPSTVGAAGSIIFGNWRDLLIGYWGGGVRVDASEHSKFTSAQVDVRTLAFCDIAVRRPASFCVAS